MGRVVEAIYENGVLKPLEKLNLKEGQRVLIKILRGDTIQIAREVRARLRERLKGKDLVEILSSERERFT